MLLRPPSILDASFGLCRQWPSQTRSVHTAAALQLHIPLAPSATQTSRAACRMTRAQISTRSVAAGSAADDEDDEDDQAAAAAGKPLRVERLLANLGYGKRQECAALVKRGKVTLAASGKAAKVGNAVCLTAVHLLVLDRWCEFVDEDVCAHMATCLRVSCAWTSLHISMLQLRLTRLLVTFPQCLSSPYSNTPQT